MFRDHANEAFSTLKENIVQMEPGEIQQAVHAIKSMSGNIGAKRLFETCHRVEAECLEKSTEDLINTLDDIASELDEVLLRIDEVMFAA